MNMAFLRSLQTCQILFYLTIVCNLATCSFNTFNIDDETRLVSGCKPKYSNDEDSYPPLITIDMMLCQNMLTSQIPFYENVTAMELINIPLITLNETEIPNSVKSHRVNLKWLHWTKSHIKYIGNIPVDNLNSLDVSWNLIQEINPNAFKRLIHLQTMNASHNNIELLPESLFSEHNCLKELSLAHNQLKVIPRDFTDRLIHLKVLDLSHNHLKYLKESTFHQNQRLENLNLSFNQISLLPTKLFKFLFSLKYLFLEANQLLNIEPDTFINQNELIVLNVGQNPLLSLPNILLPNNNTLNMLTVSHTKAIKIKPTVVQNLHALQHLYLTDNHHLQNLHNDTFINAKKLKVLHLQNNNFTQLPYSILDTELDDLLLDGNPWPCDCSIQWIVFWAYSLSTDNNQHSNNIKKYNGYNIGDGISINKSFNTRKIDSSLRLTANCNSTNYDLIDALLKLHCKPTVLRISPISYESLEAKVKLVCRSYANPMPIISWLTPNGPAYIKSLQLHHQSLLPWPSNSKSDQIIHLQKHYMVNADDDNNVYLFENGDLHIKQMTREDAGEYMCMATNKMGESFAYTRLYVDPSIMQRIKTGSIICGLLWINTFLLFSIVYLLIRRYSRRAKHEKRKRRMNENMDIYKSQQISRLRERCKNQMNRIKNNCSIQVEWMKDNYTETMNNSQDYRTSYLTNQYTEQMTEIREYYLTQMHKVREHFDQQRKLIQEFSINRVSTNELEEAAGIPHPSTITNNDVIVHMENGLASTLTTVPTIEEDDVYRYNESMKCEIRRLTSLHNLHEAFTNKCESKLGIGTTVVPSTSNMNGNDIPLAAVIRTSTSRYNLSPYTIDNNNVSNGKLRTSEEEGDENTSMLHKAKIPQQ